MALRLFARQSAVDGDVPAALTSDPREIDELAVQARRGDEGAVRELFARYFDPLYAYFRIALNDATGAEEATQETFIEALRSLPSYDGDQEPFDHWLLAIARGRVIRYLWRGHQGPERDWVNAARRRNAENTEEDELRALGWTTDADLLLLIDCLPEAERQALVLGRVLDFSPAEIGRILEQSPEAVRGLEEKALGFLRGRLSALGREGGRARHAMRRFRARRGPLRSEHSVTLLH